MRMFWTGLLFAGPSMHLWYTFTLPRLVGTSHGKVVALAKGIALDQTIYAIPFVSGVLLSLDLQKGLSPKKALENCRSKLWDIQKVSWSVWPVFQLINFSVVPLSLRPLFVSGVGLFWNMYVSFVAQRPPPP